MSQIKQILFDVMSKALWLSDDLFDRTREQNVLFFSHASGDGGIIEFGKKNYTTIAELRTMIEKTHARDMLTLHNVPRFLRSKKPTDSYTPVERRA